MNKRRIEFLTTRIALLKARSEKELAAYYATCTEVRGNKRELESLLRRDELKRRASLRKSRHGWSSFFIRNELWLTGTNGERMHRVKKSLMAGYVTICGAEVQNGTGNDTVIHCTSCSIAKIPKQENVFEEHGDPLRK